jgi:hypothetical protein
VLEVIAHEVAGHGVERLADGRYLIDDVRAVPVVPDHGGDAADLAFDSPELAEVGVLERSVHADGLSGVGGVGRAFGMACAVAWGRFDLRCSRACFGHD